MRAAAFARALLLVALASCRDETAPIEASSTSSGAGSSTTAATDSSTTGAAVDTSGFVDGTSESSSSTGADGPLHVDAGQSRYALVGELVVLDGSASLGATRYQWDKGDGSAAPPPGPDPIAMVEYAAPGRYRPVLTIFDDDGDAVAGQITISVTHPPSHVPRQSGSIALEPGSDRIAVVSPDSDEIAIARQMGERFSIEARVAVCEGPRTLAWLDGSIAVACPTGAAVQLVDPATGEADELALPRASRPFGVVADDGELFVTLQATGELARIGTDDGLALLERWPAVPDARGVAVLPDGRLAVSRWRSPDDVAQIALVDRDDGTSVLTTLQFDPREPSDTAAGGIPSWLDQLVVSPQGDRLAIPSLQANFAQGEFLDGNPLLFDETLRAVTSFLDLPSATEDFEARTHFDNRGLLSAAVWSSRGDYLFVADRGTRAVERVDMFTGGQAGVLLDVGLAPQGLALSPDDRFLFVDAYLSRELVIYDVGDFDGLPLPTARLAIVDDEPLDAELLLGKQLFNDSYDTRLAKDGYMACAHCHLDGESDRRTWDFTDRGEGVRNTTALLGHAGTGQGPLHWSANFDEVQDFEHDLRGAFGGLGLMSDEDFATGTRGEPLGDPKAGVSPELDALAAYVGSLDTPLPSPFRQQDGALTPDAVAGAALFDALGCASCHSGPGLTDSAFVGPAEPRLHDVGTITAASGQRLGAPLTGLDTPTLLELWNSPPYLHTGAAVQLRDVLVTHNPTDLHGTTSGLTEAELDQLVVFLLSLE